MAIEQMKLLSITGKDADLENFLAQKLIKCSIQIEDAKKIYDKGWKLEYYEYDYRVKEYLKKCYNLLQKFEVDFNEESNKMFIENSLDNINEELENIQIKYENSLKEIENCKKRNEEIKGFIEPIKRLKNLDVEAKKLYDCKYLKFRYGNVPNENMEELKKEIEDMEVVFFEIEKNEDVTWIIYFTTEEFVSDVDGFFNMQKFERLKIPSEIEEKPYDYVIKCYLEIEKNEKNIQYQNEMISELKKDASTVLVSIYRQLQTYEMINNLKKYIAKDQNKNFYIVVWVPESDMNDMVNMLNNFPRIEFIVKDAKKNMKAPTKLKNFSLVRPFEAIVKMYGVPNIQELDPTPFIAIVTCLMFGFMFGDVGQGAIILIAGIIMLLKKQKVGAILVDGGIFSVIFGFLYGSVFGKEDILKPILISPMENINTMLISGIVVGSIFIVIAMILNIINGIKSKNFKKAVLDGNGLAGFVMYVLVLGVVRILFFIRKIYCTNKYYYSNCWRFIISYII